jgi:hypothetical protein
MSQTGSSQAQRSEASIHVALEELNRLEDLLDDMDDLGVSTRAELERRITVLNARLDEPDDV